MLKHQRKVASMTTPPQAIYTPPPAGYGSLSQAQQSYGQQPHQPLHQANWSENRHSRVEQPLQPVPQRRASQSLPTVPQPVQIQRENYYAPQVVPEQILRQLQALTTIYQGPQAHSTRGQNGQFMGLGTQSAAAEYGHMGQQAGYQYMENQTSNSPVNLQQVRRFDLSPCWVQITRVAVSLLCEKIVRFLCKVNRTLMTIIKRFIFFFSR